jgi:hypothetical protein
MPSPSEIERTETEALADQPVPEYQEAVTLTGIPIGLDVVLTDDGPVVQFTLQPQNVYDARTPDVDPAGPPAASIEGHADNLHGSTLG